MPNESTPGAGEFLLYQTEDGQTRQDAILAVGYRVRSPRGQKVGIEVDIEPRNKLYSFSRRKPFRRLTFLPRPTLRRGPSCIRNPL